MAFSIMTVKWQSIKATVVRMTLSIMTIDKMTLSIMALGIMTLSIMALSIMTLSIMTLSIMAPRIMAERCYAECHCCSLSHINPSCEVSLRWLLLHWVSLRQCIKLRNANAPRNRTCKWTLTSTKYLDKVTLISDLFFLEKCSMTEKRMGKFWVDNFKKCHFNPLRRFYQKVTQYNIFSPFVSICLSFTHSFIKSPPLLNMPSFLINFSFHLVLIMPPFSV